MKRKIEIQDVNDVLPFVPFIVNQDTKYKNEFIKRFPKCKESEFWKNSLGICDFSLIYFLKHRTAYKQHYK